MIGGILREVWYQLFPLPRLLSVNRKVRAGTPNLVSRTARWALLGRDKLVPLLDAEWERAKQLDEKLFKLTTALSVALASAGVASKSVLDGLPDGPLKSGVICLLLYAIASLFAGTIMGFSGLRPKPRSGYGPDFALIVKRKNNGAAQAIARALADFEISNMLRANEASAANMSIRNGVIAFALAMTFSLFVPPKADAPPPAESPVWIMIDMHRGSVAADVAPASQPEDRKTPPRQPASRQSLPTN